jgi:hypothetical protein
MSGVKINERILNSIRENSNNDNIIEQFLIDLVYEEASHRGQWRWKDTYNKLIDKYLSDWEIDNEN